jgi:glyoxylase-like metal-dependent hydrolase (beta-lactamase superfamily II)
MPATTRAADGAASVEVATVVNGRWRQNCYVVGNARGEALLIDPGSAAAEIATVVESNGWRPLAILNTHAHYDHVGAVAELMERYKVPFYLHEADVRLLQRANLYRMMFEARDPIRVPQVTHNLLALSPELEIGGFRVVWMATPGHTEGSVCLRIANYLFSGDTLMRGRIGRTDLPGGSRERIAASVRMLAELPGDTIVCGGHGARTTIAAEFATGAPARSLLT